MGEKIREALKLRFDKRLRLEFHGARITSDAGLLACRELDGAVLQMGGATRPVQERTQSSLREALEEGRHR